MLYGLQQIDQNPNFIRLLRTHFQLKSFYKLKVFSEIYFNNVSIWHKNEFSLLVFKTKMFSIYFARTIVKLIY